MRRSGMTRLDAAHEWVREFDAIQQEMLEPFWNDGTLSEVTVPTVGDRVYAYHEPVEEPYGTITEYDEERDLYTIEFDNGKKVKLDPDDFEVETDGIFPMWSTMWSFGDSADDYWLEELDGIRIMSECGFRIYEHEEFGYFFGIDGCGYDFYEGHWLPLYNKRGLQWHDSRTDDPEYKPRDYDPVYKAYEALAGARNKVSDSEIAIAIEDAIGYLGEALE